LQGILNGKKGNLKINKNGKLEKLNDKNAIVTYK